MKFPSNSTIQIIKSALSGLAQIFKEGYHYKKTGIILIGLVPEGQRQLSLFSRENPRHQKLMEVVDKINISIPEKVMFGGEDPGRTWKMKQEKLSRRFTTRLGEVLLIK